MNDGHEPRERHYADAGDAGDQPPHAAGHTRAGPRAEGADDAHDATAGSGAGHPNGPNAPRRSRLARRLGWATFALAIVALSVGMAAMLSRIQPPAAPLRPGSDAPPDWPDSAETSIATRLQGERQLSPLLTGEGVVHIKSIRRTLTAQGREVDRMDIEAWYDRATGDSRDHLRSSSEPKHTIYVRQGDLQGNRHGGQKSGSITRDDPVSHGPFDNAVLFGLFHYKLLVGDPVPTDDAPLKVAGETSVAGAPAVVLRDGRDTGDSPFRVYLNRDTGLPLRVEGQALPPPEDTSAMGVQTYEYPVIEVLSRESLPPDFFSVEVVTGEPIPTPDPHAYDYLRPPPADDGFGPTPTHDPNLVLSVAPPEPGGTVVAATPAARTNLTGNRLRRERQISPLLTGEGVIHIESIQRVFTPEGKEVDRSYLAFWYDRGTGDARSHAQMPSASMNPIEVRQGDIEGYRDPKRNLTAAERVHPRDRRALVSSPVLRLFHYKLSIGDSSVTGHIPLRAVGEKSIAGTTAVALRPNDESEPLRVYLSRETGLPLRVEGQTLASARATFSGGTTTYEYTAIETLSRESLPPDFFSVGAMTGQPVPTPEPNAGDEPPSLPTDGFPTLTPDPNREPRPMPGDPPGAVETPPTTPDPDFTPNPRTETDEPPEPGGTPTYP